MWNYSEIRHHLSCMYRQESHVYPCCVDYMNFGPRTRNQEVDYFNPRNKRQEAVYDKWRRTICKWSYDIVDHFGFDRDVVYISLNYLDRYVARRLLQQQQDHERKLTQTLSSSLHSGLSGESRESDLACLGPIKRSERGHVRRLSPQSTLSFPGYDLDGHMEDNDNFGDDQEYDPYIDIDAHEFQLAGMTSLYVALKLHGKNEADPSHIDENETTSSVTFKTSKLKSVFALSSNDFARLSRGVYTKNDIIEMEQAILQVLNWRMNPPTPVDFLFYFLHALEEPDTKIKFVLYELARYFLELAVSVYDLSVRQRPSCVALTSLVMAIEAMDEASLPHHVSQNFFRGLSKIITPQHKSELPYVKLLIQDVCKEALSSSDEISSHITDLLGKGYNCHGIISGDGTPKFNFSPTSVASDHDLPERRHLNPPIDQNHHEKSRHNSR